MRCQAPRLPLSINIHSLGDYYITRKAPTLQHSFRLWSYHGQQCFNRDSITVHQFRFNGKVFHITLQRRCSTHSYYVTTFTIIENRKDLGYRFGGLSRSSRLNDLGFLTIFVHDDVCSGLKDTNWASCLSSADYLFLRMVNSDPCPVCRELFR